MSVGIETLIVRNPDFKKGRPCIAGTSITIHQIAIWYKLGWSPEEIAREYAHLNLAQIHAALAYYHANQTEVDAEIVSDENDAIRLEDAFRRHEGAVDAA